MVGASILPIDGGGMMILDGHSGSGMLMAVEMANTGAFDWLVTSSKRGRPDAPGPAGAFINNMSESCSHFLGQCDPKDPVQVKCLSDWRPASAAVEQPAMAPMPDYFHDMVAQVKDSLDPWTL